MEKKQHSNVQKPTFEEDLERLENIVNELEAGILPLEDALKRFEEGVRLYRLCEERLKDAEQRVEILLKQADGSIAEVPFEEGSDGAGDDGEPSGSDGLPEMSPDQQAPSASPDRPLSSGPSVKARSGRRAADSASLLPDDDPAGELPF